MDDITVNKQPAGALQSTERDADSEDRARSQANREERNIMCVFKLIYGVGLEALRRLFMDIHPSWQPCDAVNLDRGKMKLHKDEEISFNTGNIKQWDFSLMTTVLLFSTRCALEISQRLPRGGLCSLRTLKECRNKLIGHAPSSRMSDADFNKFWPLLSANFVQLGADPDKVAEIILQSDEDLHAGDYYRNLFLEDQAKEQRCERRLERIETKVDTIVASQSSCGTPQGPSNSKDPGSPRWDEWSKFRAAVGDFDANQNQYILVTDALSSREIECYADLRAVAWKMILDFDPLSEEEGLYQAFTSKEGQRRLVSMFTPAELKRCSMSSLLRMIDPNKILWLFVNGRRSDYDGGAMDFPEWEGFSVKHVSSLFRCCSDPDKFDKQKTLVCLVLPFSPKSMPFLQLTLSRLVENFDEFDLKFVSLGGTTSHFPKRFNVQTFDLPPEILKWGLKEMFSTSTISECRMPTSHAGVHVTLTQNQFLYLKECLDILYDGCEDLPDFSEEPAEADNQLRDFLEEHRRSFMSGNQISFVSLYDNHDAKRGIERDIQIHIQRLLDQGLTRSMIVDIRHSPGTGGTTIARRVLWDLSKAYPCAFVEIRPHHYIDEDNTFVNKLAEHVTALEEICHTSPVILIDGKQAGAVEGLSNKLVRMLSSRGRRALLLRCQRGSKASSKGIQEPSHVHQVFDVKVKLEDSVADLNKFKSKYKEYIEQSLDDKPTSDLCRVFHFPLMAMMEEFRPSLEKIIEDTLNVLGGLQQEMAVVVAFLQKYANLPTPALLLHEAFKRYIRGHDHTPVTYEGIKQLFSQHLINLMVPVKPSRGKRIARKSKETPQESYTLQHPLVAKLLLEKVFQRDNRDLFGIVSQFLRFPIFQHDRFVSVIEELFLYNKNGEKKFKFSILFEELKVIDSGRAADVFCLAAEKTNNSVIFANAARFNAKKEPPSFSKAKELIERALQVHRPGSKGGYKSLYHTKGVVLYFELRQLITCGEVQDLIKLEELATKVLEAHRAARTFPPTYPHPLIGEVEVWLACIDWIMKNMCQGDSDETLEFLTNLSPPFFRTCISDCFHLLDVVDGIVQSVPNLSDPEETNRLCNNLRLALIKAFRRDPLSTSRRQDVEDIVQACKALCTAKNFPTSSQVELKKLQAQFILSSSDQIDTLKQENLVYLLRLLEELVLIENEYRLAYHLMKVCLLVTGPRCYSLEQGINVTEKWLVISDHDCLPYFYQMAMYFLKILDGFSLEFMPKYNQVWKKCRDRSHNHLRSTQSTLFVGKEGHGMSRLITRNKLFRGETDYSHHDPEKVSKFWQVDSRKKLLECKGRIRVEPYSGPGKSRPYIELVQGNIELYVGKNADIGQVERDFTPGALVYFVVSFNLHGPVANGIKFSSQDPRQHHAQIFEGN